MNEPRKETNKTIPIPSNANKSGGKNNFHKNGKNNHGKENWLNKKNNPFNVPELNKLAESKKQEIDFETKRDLIWELEEEGRKKTKTAQDIFYRLNSITYKKNQKNNQYLFDFKRRLLEKLKGERGKEQIWEDLKRVYNRFTVHGQKTSAGLNQRADIDAAASILLLEMAGFTQDGYKDITYVGNGEAGPGVNIDTSDKAIGGIMVEGYEKRGITTARNGKIRTERNLFGTKLFIDEHGNGPCSSTRMVYQILKDFGKIPNDKRNQVKRFVEFIDIVDDLGYQASGVVSPYLERTIFGLYKSLPTGFIFNYFKDPNKTGFEYLDDKCLSENKVNIWDAESKQKEEKTLKQLSDEKKNRMDKGFQEFKEVEKKGYFLMYGDTRFIVDLGGKLTDGPETVSILGYGIIRLFPSTGDLYIYSPNKLPSKLGGFDVLNDHFVVDKIGSGKDLNKLLNEFKYLAERKFTTTIDPGSKWNLKKEIIDYRKKIESEKQKAEIEKELAKKQKIETKDLGLKHKFAELPELSVDKIEISKDYDGIVNNVQGNIVFVTFDKNNTVRGTLHKNDTEDLELFKSIISGDKLSVKIKEIQKNGDGNKIKLSLNKIIKDIKEEVKVA